MIKLFKGLEKGREGRYYYSLWKPLSFLIETLISYLWVSPVAQLVKNLPVMQEILIQFLCREGPGEGIGYPLQSSWASLVT